MEVSSSLRRLFVTKTGIGGAHNGRSAQGATAGVREGDIKEFERIDR